MLRPLTKYTPHSVSPAFINPNQLPRKFGRDVVEKYVGCRMHVQRGGDEKQQRWLVAQFAAGKISEALKFSASAVPLDSRPVVKPLQRQMDIFFGLELDHGEAALAGYR